MTHPWDRWLTGALPAPTAYNAHLRAMLGKGMKAVLTEDIGMPGIFLGSRTTFACGCVRVYRADVRTKAEREGVRPCESHGNLLTSPAEWEQNTDTESKAPEQQENPDDADDDLDRRLDDL